MPSTAAALRQQWEEPADIFTVLLIIGGEIIQCALGAVSGGTLTPVTFSYGWAAYALSALLSTMGECQLMPGSPIPNLLVINVNTGYPRVNRSWTLGRLFQTYKYWMPQEVRTRVEHPIRINLDEETALPSEFQTPIGTGDEALLCVAPLCVAVYDWDVDMTEETKKKKKNKPGTQGHDWVWGLGLVVTVIQLGVSIIPFVLYDDWRVFLVTGGGTVLAYLYGALPQWRKEKWACRKGYPKKHVALTMGNGTQHVVIIRGHSQGLDLEDLAGGQVRDAPDPGLSRVTNLLRSDRATQVLTFVFAILWLLLLITSTGIETHTWYLLAVGGMGTMHNLIVAGAPRRPDMLGIPIKLATSEGEKSGIVNQISSVTEAGDGQVVKGDGQVAAAAGQAAQQGSLTNVFAEVKIMFTLMELELAYKGFGKALLGEFFPGTLRDWEKEWWKSDDAKLRKDVLKAKRSAEYQNRRKSATHHTVDQPL
ncbi:uncharacterized protein N7479_003750 [Penicillium vulpinum]|uniref:Uncharacterized protein n=1 Tax=Penicillium vulpinum TaxID=29845 RepID=A0A1V6RRV0_9EURO|nr:uncharacterized protein N7479_003750 [Penicillium vulpinum]KAJ5963874.1 hypothetical protein N7479_003750 [Penicillium vulpinum]OQE04501.1 hypothetical protein PENVUL_c032G03894 [Penicillium vulpinum]